MEQMMECLVATIEKMDAKIHAKQKEMKGHVKEEVKKEGIKTNQEILARMGAKMDTTLMEMKEELMARLEAKMKLK
jgi:hypothetical protein